MSIKRGWMLLVLFMVIILVNVKADATMILAETDFGPGGGTVESVSLFTTDYTNGFGGSPYPGEYEIATTASGHGPSDWGGTGHGGSGGFMLVDGAMNSSLAILEYSFMGVANVQYALNGWIQNVVNYTDNAPILSFWVNNTQIDTFGPSTSVQSWENFTFNYTPTSTGSITFSLHDNNTIHGANDFGLDDIVLSSNQVPEPATMLLFSTGIAVVAGIRIRRKMK